MLVWNALLAPGLLCAFGLFRPTTPEIFIMATLLVSGCCRSLQFTSLNAISYADVDSPRMGQASSLSGMLQQLSLSLGVAIGGYSLEISGALTDRPATELVNFYWAFVVVGLISASSAWWAWRLPRHAGAEMAGRARGAREAAIPAPRSCRPADRIARPLLEYRRATRGTGPSSRRSTTSSSSTTGRFSPRAKRPAGLCRATCGKNSKGI